MSSERKKQKFCQYCGERTLHAKPTFPVGWGIFLSLITLGLFVPLWIIGGVLDLARAWQCQRCGLKG